MLRALGGEVTVCARRAETFAAAEAAGLRHISPQQLSQRAWEYALIINTADAMLIDAPVVAALEPGAVVVDVATAMGVDLEAAAKHGVIAMHAPGLPGKYAPLSAARIIKDTILAITEEELG